MASAIVAKLQVLAAKNAARPNRPKGADIGKRMASLAAARKSSHGTPAQLMQRLVAIRAKVSAKQTAAAKAAPVAAPAVKAV